MVKMNGPRGGPYIPNHDFVGSAPRTIFNLIPDSTQNTKTIIG